jgi:RimJ/RimL family protein N-acetyltransferase
VIETERLLVRPWRDADRAPFAAMGADPEVMRYLGPLQSRADADAGIDRAIAHQAAHGFCFWAVERREDGAFVGFCGLKRVDLAATPISGDVEIGWRLRRDAWGAGYAREAAAVVLDFGLRGAGLERIVAMTNHANSRSWGLMARLGMTRRPDLDFDHPGLAAGDPLRPHIVYAIGPDAAA